jgi:hypothetical protein
VMSRSPLTYPDGCQQTNPLQLFPLIFTRDPLAAQGRCVLTSYAGRALRYAARRSFPLALRCQT